MIAKEQRIKVAKERFLSENPALQNKLSTLTNDAAEHLALTLKDYRDLKLNQEFNNHAKSCGIPASDLVINLCAENKEEKAAMYLEDV